MTDQTQAVVMEEQGLVISKMQPGSEIVGNFDSLKAYIDQKTADYKGATYTLGQYKNAKRDRAYLNGLSKDLNSRRLEVKRIYSEPIVAFETKIKELDAPIKELADAIDQQIKSMEAELAATKRAELVEYYRDFAGALADVVPFERIEDPKWTNVTCTTGREDIEAIVNKIADEEAMLTELNLPHDLDVKAEYWATLDFKKAVAKSKEVEANLEKARYIEQVKADQLRAQADENARAEAAKAVETVVPAPAPEPMSMRAPEPVPAVQEDPRKKWTLNLTCTRAEASQIGNFLRGMGIPFEVKS